MKQSYAKNIVCVVTLLLLIWLSSSLIALPKIDSLSGSWESSDPVVQKNPLRPNEVYIAFRRWKGKMVLAIPTGEAIEFFFNIETKCRGNICNLVDADRSNVIGVILFATETQIEFLTDVYLNNTPSHLLIKKGKKFMKISAEHGISDYMLEEMRKSPRYKK